MVRREGLGERLVALGGRRGWFVFEQPYPDRGEIERPEGREGLIRCNSTLLRELIQIIGRLSLRSP